MNRCIRKKLICPAENDFLRAREADCGFGACGGENPSASCVRLGAGECETCLFLFQANEMFPLPLVDELAGRGNEIYPKFRKNGVP